MNSIWLFVFLLTISWLGVSVRAQTKSGHEQTLTQKQIQRATAEIIRQRQEMDARTDKTFSELSRLSQVSSSRRSLPNISIWKHVQRSVQTEERLKVHPEDYSKYQFILSGGKTGILKLLGQPDCRRLVGRALVECVQLQLQNYIFGGGYSFRDERYVIPDYADLIMAGNRIGGRAVGMQTLLVDLGDIALPDISLVTDGMKYLAAFVPEGDSSMATEQRKQLVKGLKNGNHVYWASVWARANTTFALRSISYDMKDRDSSLGKSEDVIVAFRIVRRHDDGSLTLIWKELHRTTSPKLVQKKLL